MHFQYHSILALCLVAASVMARPVLHQVDSHLQREPSLVPRMKKTAREPIQRKDNFRLPKPAAKVVVDPVPVPAPVPEAKPPVVHEKKLSSKAKTNNKPRPLEDDDKSDSDSDDEPEDKDRVKPTFTDEDKELEGVMTSRLRKPVDRITKDPVDSDSDDELEKVEDDLTKDHVHGEV